MQLLQRKNKATLKLCFQELFEDKSEQRQKQAFVCWNYTKMRLQLRFLHTSEIYTYNFPTKQPHCAENGNGIEKIVLIFNKTSTGFNS